MKKVKSRWGMVYDFKPGDKVICKPTYPGIDPYTGTIKSWVIKGPKSNTWGCTIITEDGDERFPGAPDTVFPCTKLDRVLK